MRKQNAARNVSGAFRRVKDVTFGSLIEPPVGCVRERNDRGAAPARQRAIADIGYASSRVRRREEGRAVALNPRAMIDATIFAVLVGAIATPVSWWGLSRFG